MESESEQLLDKSVDIPKNSQSNITQVPWRFWVHNILAISALSVVGVACRIALLQAVKRAEIFPQATTISVNFFGSFLMGFLVTLSKFDKLYPYTFTGLTVGFCGSITTFSSWIASIMTNGNAVIEVSTGSTMPFIAYAIGRDLANSVSLWFPLEKSIPHLDQAFCYISVLIVTLFLILFGVLRGENSINFVVACALGPIGALSRWLLCLFLNNRVLASLENKRFRFGTLLSNLFAVIITGCLHKYNGGNSQSTNWILMGICGSLSTVSSWVSDTVSIYTQVSRKWAYLYCTNSVSLCVLIMIPFIN